MAAAADLSTHFALDVQAVNGLRVTAKKTGQAGLEAAARQFEALFLNMMLKSMRDATPQDSLMDNEQSRLFMSMFDQQIAQNMASRGVGMADVMIRQLRHAVPAEPPASSPVEEAIQHATWGGGNDLSAPVAGHAGQPAPAAPALPPQQPGAFMQQRQSFPESVQPGSATQLPRAEGEAGESLGTLDTTGRAMLQSGAQAQAQTQAQVQIREFQARLMPYAQQASQATGIPAVFMLGQAALESGWGRKEIRGADGTQSFNLFGVKAGSNWKGAVVETVTTEYVNGTARKSVEKFRAYSSYAEAFHDYANLLRNNPRYADVVSQAVQGLDADGFAQGLQRAGYATDPNYAEKLGRIIRTTPWSS